MHWQSVTSSNIYVYYAKMHEWDRLYSTPGTRKFYLRDRVLCGIHCFKAIDLINVPLHNETNQTQLRNKKNMSLGNQYFHNSPSVIK
jgi:hypothetical protein